MSLVYAWVIYLIQVMNWIRIVYTVDFITPRITIFAGFLCFTSGGYLRDVEWSSSNTSKPRFGCASNKPWLDEGLCYTTNLCRHSK